MIGEKTVNKNALIKAQEAVAVTGYGKFWQDLTDAQKVFEIPTVIELYINITSK